MDTLTTPQLRRLGDDTLYEMYCAAGDQAERDRIEAAIEWRDQAPQRAQRRAATTWAEVEREWEEAARAQYDAVMNYCGGDHQMLSPAGERAGRHPWPMLWQGSEEDARKLASEEVGRFWDVQPRIPNPGKYKTAKRDEATRAAEQAAEDGSGDDMPGGGLIAGLAKGTAHVAGRAAIDAGRIGVRTAVRSAAASQRNQGRAPAGPSPRMQRVAAIRQRQADQQNDRTLDALPPADLPQPSAELAVPAQAATERRPPGTVATTVPQRIDGARVLEQGFGWLQHMAHWDNPWVPVAATLAAASAHARDPEQGNALVWLNMPRLFYTGQPDNVEGGEGKSVKARYTAWLCPDPQRITEMTKAYLISQMAKGKTVIVTELDNVVGPSGRRNAWLPGLANAGFEFDGKTGRKQDRQDVDVPLFGMFILDGKAFIMHTAGPNLGPLWARCLIFRSMTAPKGYVAPRFDREARAHGLALRSRFSRWMAQEVADGIGDHKPQIPDGLGNRPLDLWWNLFCVAERAGGPWPELAREACKRVESVAGVPEQDAAEDAAITARQAGWDVQLPSVPGGVIPDDGWGDEA